MFDDRLLVDFIGSDILLGGLVVVSRGIRFGGILSLWVNTNSSCQQIEAPTQLVATRISVEQRINYISFTRPDFAPERMIWLKG